MEVGEIKLVRNKENPRKAEVIGLNGDLIVDDRIVNAVKACRMLFPLVVEHVAMNRTLAEVPDATPRGMDGTPNPCMLLHMFEVRNELIVLCEKATLAAD